MGMRLPILVLFYFSDMILGETTCDGKKKMFEILNREVKDTFILDVATNLQVRKWNSALYVGNWAIDWKTRKKRKFNVKITGQSLCNWQSGNQTKIEKILPTFLSMGKLVPAPFKGYGYGKYPQSLRFYLFQGELKTKWLMRLGKRLGRFTRIKDNPEYKNRKRILITGGPNTGVKEKVIKIFDDFGADVVVLNSLWQDPRTHGFNRWNLATHQEP